jgi:hypothetical protein
MKWPGLTSKTFNETKGSLVFIHLDINTLIDYLLNKTRKNVD